MPNLRKIKGSKAEQEVVDILDEMGIPSSRVIGSGAVKGSGGDIKIGLILSPIQKKRFKKFGEKPARDACSSITKGEVKAVNKMAKEWLFESIDGSKAKEIANLAILSPKLSSDACDALDQNPEANHVFLRRAKVPHNAKNNKDYNKVFAVVMGLEDYIELMKKAYPEIVVVSGEEVAQEEREHRPISFTPTKKVSKLRKSLPSK